MAKVQERLGAPFVHQLEEWHPDRRFTLQEIIEAFELDLDRVKGKASAQTDDPILKALESRGLLKGQISGKEGVWDITCPWLAWIFAKGKGTQKIPLKPARYEL
jgi:hypothetical protein